MTPLPRLRVRWRRDWRLGRSLVGEGSIEGRGDGRGGTLRLAGRRTGPVRSLLVVAVRLLAVGAFAAGCAAVTLTSIGMTWRTKAPEWLAWSIPGTLAVLLLVVLAAVLLRRLLEPRVVLELDWAAVEALHSDGWRLELRLRQGRATWHGRMRPLRYSGESRALLRALREGRPLPGMLPGMPAGGWPKPRSRRVDQAAMLASVALLGGVGWLLWPALARHLVDPTGGPAAGVPARAPAAVVEAQARACPRGPEGAPAVRNRRVGEDLAWSLEGEADGFAVVPARWEPGQGLRSLPAEQGSAAGALADEEAVGLTLVVPQAQEAAVRARLDGGDLEGALCGGQVARLDLAVGSPAEGPALRLSRDGEALVARADEVDGAWRLVVARQRDTGRLDWLDRCELAVHDGRLVLPRLEGELRLPGFFDGSRDQARAVLVRGRDADVVRRRLGAREAVPCAELDALGWTGLGTAVVGTAPAAGTLRQDVADRVRGLAVVRPGDDHDAIVGGLHQGYRQTATAWRGRMDGRADWQALNEGYLDGLPWGAILDGLSMQHDLAQVERIRQRLSGEDPLSTLGELFLLRLAEELLERVEPEPDQYEARLDVAQAWLEVGAGHTWEAHGRTVRVPDDEVAAYYQVVGHYLLVDVARRVEQHMARDLAFRVTGLPLRMRLQQHGIHLDIEKGSTQKALEAWVTGDFEYLGDRAVAKLQEEVTNQSAAIAAASSARYRLAGQWSAQDGVARTAALLRDGQEIGWVAIYDAARVRVGYHVVGGRGTSRQALGEGGTALLATAGSYVTQEGKTAGLSAVDGHVDNFLISNRMEGLVIVDGDGGLHLLDMRDGGRLPGQEQLLQPLERLADLHLLLRWLQDHDASAFQTHLLGHGGALAIDESKASPTVRERHLLVQAEYRGNPLVAVVDLPGSPKVSLFEAAVITIQALRTPEADGGPGLDVVAIANLDVGSYNALESWSDDGRTLRQSWKPIGETMNLVSVARR